MKSSFLKFCVIFFVFVLGIATVIGAIFNSAIVLVSALIGVGAIEWGHSLFVEESATARAIHRLVGSIYMCTAFGILVAISSPPIFQGGEDSSYSEIPDCDLGDCKHEIPICERFN